jgi:hypothetical protein
MGVGDRLSVGSWGPTKRKSELFLVLLCMRTLKATKRGESLSNYLFLFLSRRWVVCGSFITELFSGISKTTTNGRFVSGRRDRSNAEGSSTSTLSITKDI